MAPEEDAPAISVGDGEALRLAVTLAAASGLLSPLDLAAVDVAARPAMGVGARSLAESASESAVRSSLPHLVDPHCADPTAPPRGVESWSAVHRRCHRPDATLAMGAEVACRVDAFTGKLWTWGVDVGHGMLGDGGQSDEEDAPTSTAANQFTNTPSVTRKVRHAPRVVRFKERISSSVSSSVTVAGVSLGDAHVVCVDTCGKLWTWGSNRQGQLGRPSVGYARHELSLESELEDSDFDPRPTRVDGFGEKETFVTSASAGCWHTVVIDAVGAAHAFGYNHSGQLGLPRSTGDTCTYNQTGQTGPNGDPRYSTSDVYSVKTVWKRPVRLTHVYESGVRFVSASAGKHRTVLLDTEGSVWTAFCNEMSIGRAGTCGSNLSGDDYTESSDTTTPEPWVRRLPPNPRRVVNVPKMVYLDMSHETALMVDTTGGVWAWGKGNEGQTGLGHVKTATSPAGPLRGDLQGVRVARVRTGDEHCLAVTANGALYGFGRGDDGRLWGAVRNVHRPARLCPGKSWSAVACGSVVDGMGGSKGACVGVSADDGRVYSWGAARPWLGRGGGDADGAMWARSNDIGAVLFDDDAK